MAQVAKNQDRAVELRQEYSYRQIARVRLLQKNGKLRWDETREYEVQPAPRGIEAKLIRSHGQRRNNGRLLPFDLQGRTPEASGRDAGLVENLHSDLGIQNKTRDGLAPDMFPLTSREQRSYVFTLEGEEHYRGRNVYRLGFEPRPDGGATREGLWKGEVLVDGVEYQPVFLATQFALQVPRWALAVFGINIRQVGFSLSYDRFNEDVWFPVSYGGEFFIKLFHFYKRTATVSVVNKNFRR